MDIQYFGANCVRLTTKKANLIVDDNLSDLGLSSVTKSGDIALFTGAHGDPDVEVKILLDYPGEYEVSGVSVKGVAARSHIDESGKKSAVMYKLVMEDLRIAVVGHIYPELSEEQLEEIGTVDVLIIPVGGNGYTLDGAGAFNIVKKIDPRLVIPTHYADSKIKYPVEQQSLESALKTIELETRESVDKAKIKPSDLTDIAQVLVLKRQ